MLGYGIAKPAVNERLFAANKVSVSCTLNIEFCVNNIDFCIKMNSRKCFGFTKSIKVITIGGKNIQLHFEIQQNIFQTHV